MDILFFLPTLGRGGTERVVGILAEEFSKTYEVGILTFAKCQADEIDPTNITLLSLNCLRDSPNRLAGFLGNVPRLFRLIKMLRRYKPKVILSFLPQCNVLSILASLFCRSRVVVNERNVLKRQNLSKPWVILRQRLYPYAAQVWCNSDEIAHELKEQTGCKVRITKNPVRFGAQKKNYGNQKKLISVGRLVEQKGFDTLVRSFSLSGLDRNGWIIDIYGDGPLLFELKKLVNEMGLELNVKFHGSHKIVSGELIEADIFILCSKYEGLSNAMLEAMSCGIPCVLTESAGSVTDKLKKMGNAVIVQDDERHIAQALTRLALDSSRQREIGKKGLEWSRQYESSRVASEGIELLGEIA